ncbi:MAG: MCP methyltransferase, CheR-type [Candidatus Daviesbacteria bacterium GW2011_GWB1_41_5]|uniref:MCP methyltransferase, CheR-type n=1 Tax=Candidatus Daviesbacteria bacterium GW2011_GWB1_41_5 TaxID=1618429 RepID=A0A0G0WIJ7_9BACT|nr:MAG: MCP methyltransferase, CheR-type [Candidatus Daviesbacteria bacterium GW2011_GWB1_41_5]
MKENAIKKTLDIYSGTGWIHLFAKWKFWEEPYEELEELVPKNAKIVDVGCGEGILDNFLALGSRDRRILGFDINRERLSVANRKVSNTQFRYGDATKSTIPSCDVIIFFHVLHHFNSYKEQEIVLRKCYKALGKGGKLLIVEVEIKPSLKYWICWFFDFFIVPWVFEKKLWAPAFFRRSKDWKKFLDKLGFHCKIIPAEAGRPFSNVILDCSRL